MWEEKNEGTPVNVFDITDYTPFIKNKCFLCDKEFKNSLSYYMRRGNCCPECNTALEYSTRLSKNPELREKHKRSAIQLYDLINSGLSIRGACNKLGFSSMWGLTLRNSFSELSAKLSTK